MANVQAKLARWADEWVLAFKGLGLAFRSWKFDLTVVLVFVLFGTLMGMLAYSASWNYLFNLPDLGAKLQYLGSRFLSISGIENITMLVISVLQAFLIGMIALVFKKKRSAGKSANAKSGKGASTQNNASIQKAGIITGLAILAGGCPTCGTSLLMPLIGAVFSGSSAAVGSAISWLLTALAIIIALFSFKKLGEETYVIIVSERRRENGKV